MHLSIPTSPRTTSSSHPPTASLQPPRQLLLITLSYLPACRSVCLFAHLSCCFLHEHTTLSFRQPACLAQLVCVCVCLSDWLTERVHVPPLLRVRR
mmetsp:Transcript_13596/g.26971  ORF Transcript_13596/g.26971 Transcript_13596/m.26971 type:complete len:96 (-) Transcript_13596:1045-1332(-)